MMTRKEFLQICAALGLTLPLKAVAPSLKHKLDSNSKIYIIGAGAGGLTAGYLLKQQGIPFEILEASNVYGGRFRRNLDFADFPIPLGAEWLHVRPSVFDEIVNDPSIKVNVKTKGYDHGTYWGYFEGNRTSARLMGFTIDRKFIQSSWFDFYEEYIVPSVKDHIRYQKVVTHIDYRGEAVKIHTADETFESDKVIINIPVKMLQLGNVTFSPTLPESKVEALQNVKVWDGFKAFIQFSKAFYPTFIGYRIQPRRDGQRLYYDAAYGQPTNQNVLGLFSVGTGARRYIDLPEEDRIAFILKELDEQFDGAASKYYIKHLFQNWNAEPYIQGAYLTDHEKWKNIRALGTSVNNKLFFAGCAYTNGEDWSSVHTAARSALRAVKAILRNRE